MDWRSYFPEVALPRILQFGFFLSMLFGLFGLGYKLFISPSGPVDLEVFYYAAEQAIAGGPFIGTGAASDTPARNPYGYLPISIIVFYPLTLVSLNTVHIFLIVTQLVATVFTVRILTRIVKHRGGTIRSTDKALITGFLVLPIAASTNLHIGQINHLLLLFFVAGYWMIVTNRSCYYAGICFAIPALVKIWPSVLGLWLLKQRAYRAVIAAIGVGVSGIVLSILTFGLEMHYRYFHWLFTVRSRTNLYAGGFSPNDELLSIRRAISVIFPNLDPLIMALIGVVIVAIPVIYILHSSNNDPLDSFTAVLVGFFLVFPSVEHYMLFPLFLITLYAYTPNPDFSRRWLAAPVVLVPLIILPRNILDVSRLIMPSSAVSSITPGVLILFRFMHPATVGMLILLVIVILRSIPGR